MYEIDGIHMFPSNLDLLCEDATTSERKRNDEWSMKMSSSSDLHRQISSPLPSDLLSSSPPSSVCVTFAMLCLYEWNQNREFLFRSECFSENTHMGAASIRTYASTQRLFERKRETTMYIIRSKHWQQCVQLNLLTWLREREGKKAKRKPSKNKWGAKKGRESGPKVREPKRTQCSSARVYFFIYDFVFDIKTSHFSCFTLSASPRSSFFFGSNLGQYVCWRRKLCELTRRKYSSFFRCYGAHSMLSWKYIMLFIR